MNSFSVLKKNGFQYIEPLRPSSIRKFKHKIYESDFKEPYNENLALGKEILNELGLDISKMLKLHREIYHEEADPNSFYAIVRIIKPGDQSEGFRTHFDSHRFTIVVPIKIPSSGAGKLYFKSNVRNEPTSELNNIFGKIIWKFLSFRFLFSILDYVLKFKFESFHDYKPIIFLGRTTIHGNLPIVKELDEKRITILLHFFDPSPMGIGAYLRKIRGR